MNPAWGPTLVTAVIALLTGAATYGMVRQALRDVLRRLDAFDMSQSKQWGQITENTADIAHIQGALSVKPRARGANGSAL